MTLLRHPENPVNADNKADALEEAVSLIDELCALADDYVTNGGRPRLADLRRRRTALEPLSRRSVHAPRGDKESKP